jgi:hypothetical protein
MIVTSPLNAGGRFSMKSAHSLALCRPSPPAGLVICLEDQLFVERHLESAVDRFDVQSAIASARWRESTLHHFSGGAH